MGALKSFINSGHCQWRNAPAVALPLLVVTVMLTACGGGGSNQSDGVARSLQQGDSAPAFVPIAGAAEVISTPTAGAGYTLVWANEPGGVSVATDGANNVYSVLWDYNPGGDIYLSKRNADGALQWQVRFDNTDLTRHEVATWVDTDSQGNVLVSGTIRSGYSNPVNANSVLMKFSPEGQLLWRNVYAAPFDSSSTRKLVLDGADNIYVLGLGMSPFGQRTTVRKFGADGSTLWAWFDPVGIGSPLNFKWTADGDLVIAGRSSAGSLNGYARIGQGGNTVWALAAFSSPTAGDVAGDATGNSYLINGSTVVGGGSVLRKLGPTGTTVWEVSHPMSGQRIEIGSDGAPVIGGFPSVNTVGAAFAKFNPAGGLLWANLDADGPGVALLAHAQMRLDAFDNAYLAAGNLSQMGVTKVRGDGSSAWTALIPFGYAYSLAFGSNQTVFVAGGTVARIDQAIEGSPPPPSAPYADLALSLYGTPDPVRTKTDLVITATVVNQSTSPATQVNFGSTLPTGEEAASVTASQGTCSGTFTINCTLGSLDAGGTATVTMTLRVNRTRGALYTSASVNGSELDPVPANNTATLTTTVQPRLFRPRR